MRCFSAPRLTSSTEESSKSGSQLGVSMDGGMNQGDGRLSMTVAVTSPPPPTDEFSDLSLTADDGPFADRFDASGIFKTSDLPQRCVGKCVLQLGDVTVHNIQQLKTVNLQSLPVQYNERIYEYVLNAGEFAKLAYFNDLVAGAVCCRIDTKNGKKRLYIMMISVLSAYRRYHVGSMLISHVLALCERFTYISSVYLHVQSNNDEAMAFYKKFGFEVVGRVEHYYKNMQPDDAYLLEKVVNGGEKSVTADNASPSGELQAES